MAILQVKDFPPTLYEDLRRCAKAKHRSISQQTVMAIREHLSPPKGLVDEDSGFEDEREARRRRRQGVLKEIQQLPTIAIPPDFPSPAEIIREIRDER
jgi:hypothetical protein